MATFSGFPLTITNNHMESTLQWDVPPVKEISILEGATKIYQSNDCSGILQVSPRESAIYTLQVTPIEGSSYSLTVTVMVNADLKLKNSTHVFSPERENQFQIEGEGLLKIGISQVIGSTKKPIGINSYSFNKCTERYPEVNNPLDLSQANPGMKDLKIPIYHFDSGILLDFDLDSPLAVFAPSLMKEIYATESNDNEQPRSLGFRLLETPPYRMVSSYYYQPVLDSVNALVNDTSIMNPNSFDRDWIAYRLHSTYTINPRSGKVLFQDGETGLDLAYGEPTFWMTNNLAQERLSLSGKEQSYSKLNTRMNYTYGYDFTEYSGCKNLNFYMGQDHYVINLYSDFTTEVILNDNLLNKYPNTWSIVDGTLPLHRIQVSGVFSYDFYLDPNTKEIYNATRTTVYGNWFIKRNLPTQDQSMFANWAGFTSYATQAYLETWEANLKKQIKEGKDLKGVPLTGDQILSLTQTLKGLRKETAYDLQFPQSAIQAIPGNLEWNGSKEWALMDPTLNQIHLTGSFINVDVSNSRVHAPLSFDEHRALPILVTGSVTIVSDFPQINSADYKD